MPMSHNDIAEVLNPLDKQEEVRQPLSRQTSGFNSQHGRLKQLKLNKSFVEKYHYQ